MANHKSALKKIRVNARRRQRNRIVISRTRTELRTARETVSGGDLKAAQAATVEAIRALDKAVSKGILHRNNAARRKSRLMKRLAEMQADAK